MGQQIIGRKREMQELTDLYNSGKPEFVVVYGRRRVGKTYLVRELFDSEFVFYHTGLSPAELFPGKLMQQQLQAFNSSLIRYGGNCNSIPENWLEAFDRLIDLVEQSRNPRKLIFLDELAWMDTKRSGFITALEHFWNGWAAGNPDVILITCSSSTSWVNDKLINNHGGLYGRLTSEIKLEPFTLAECESYFESMNLEYSRYDQLQCYMAFGGIPYYLSHFKRGLSVAQNIDQLYFSPTGQLRNEFNRLFASAFINAEECKQVIKLLSTRRKGFTRKEIAQRINIPTGGGLTALLQSLVASDFVSTYVNYAHTSRHTFYRLSDMFCLFSLFFSDKYKGDDSFWQDNFATPKLNAWRGFAFESIAFNHIPQLKKALGITGVKTNASPWHSDAKVDGAQVDMVIERADHVINLCEMKFCDDDFTIDASYDKVLRQKLSQFAQETKTHATLHLTLVTTYGLAQSPYSSRFVKVITMNDLFT